MLIGCRMRRGLIIYKIYKLIKWFIIAQHYLLFHRDGDSILDFIDNCILSPNADQSNIDGDNEGKFWNGPEDDSHNSI